MYGTAKLRTKFLSLTGYLALVRNRKHYKLMESAEESNKCAGNKLRFQTKIARRFNIMKLKYNNKVKCENLLYMILCVL